jgi:hypothetical protein
MRLKHLAFGPLSGTLWIAVLSASVAIDVGAQPAWRPEKPVEMIITTAPGGSNDQIARIIQRIWARAMMTELGLAKQYDYGSIHDAWPANADQRQSRKLI